MPSTPSSDSGSNAVTELGERLMLARLSGFQKERTVCSHFMPTWQTAAVPLASNAALPRRSWHCVFDPYAIATWNVDTGLK